MNKSFFSEEMRSIMAPYIDKIKRDSRLVRNLLLFILLVLNTGIIFPKWVPTNGPGGGEITAIASSANNIFAGSYTGGPYLSTNIFTHLPLAVIISLLELLEKVFGNALYLNQNCLLN